MSGGLEAVVLAGGFGTRLRAVVADVPKPMAPVAGRPFLSWVLAQLASQGVGRVVLSVGYLHEVIVDFFGEAFEGMAIDYAIEPQPLGTGGAVAQALSRCRGEHALVLNGDTYIDLDIASLEQAWQRERRCLVVGRQVADTARYGRIGHDGDGRVRSFAEKGGSGPGVINAGVYLLPVDLLRGRPLSVPYALEQQVLVPLAEQGRLALHVAPGGRFIDIGVPEDYAAAQAMDWTRAGDAARTARADG